MNEPIFQKVKVSPMKIEEHALSRLYTATGDNNTTASQIIKEFHTNKHLPKVGSTLNFEGKILKCVSIDCMPTGAEGMYEVTVEYACLRDPLGDSGAEPAEEVLPISPS